MRIAILGPLEVQQDGDRLTVAGARVKTLLARLALDVGVAVPATALADAIWDGDLPGDELHALQALVSRLRRALGDPALVRQSAAGYRLALGSDDVDASAFTRLAADGARRLGAGDPQGARAALAEGLALWRGAALADVAGGPSLHALAAALDDLRVTARVDRAAAEIALGRSAELVAELEALAAAHPLHERIAGQLMQALYGAGRQADALAVYERMRGRLDGELGVTPSPELQEIHLAVVTGAPPPAAPAPAVAVGPPSPPAPAPARSNLTARLTSFVGREDELGRVGELLRAQRLLTLVGTGGAGKTRLSAEIAERVAGEMRDGVWFVELAPVADDEAIVPAILGALGVREVELLVSRSPMPGGDALSHLADILGDREALLVLDNCEHLLEPVAHTAERLLGACPRLRLLCTSREPLAITGETIVPLAPLALPAPDGSAAEALTAPAVALFADRAASASTGFVVDEATVADVVEICRRVDGLPLAIELAAARLRSMTLAQLAERLDDRFRVLTGGSRTASARQRTLRAVVDWSWDLLDVRERALLARLAVFAGGVTLQTAERVCAGGAVSEAEVFDVLCALVDKSLVQITDHDGPRYRLLETIREYGLERLGEAGELEPMRTAHARHYARLVADAAPRLRGREQLPWLARLRAEHDDVLAALRQLGAGGDARGVCRMVVGMLWFWLLSGARQEVITWTSFAVGTDGEADPLDRALIDGVHTLTRAFSGESGGEDPWRGLIMTLDRVEDADLSGHPLLAALRPLLAVAVGRDRVRELLQRSADHPDPWVRATVPFVRGQLAENDGDLDAMRAALGESLRAFGEIGDRWGQATTLSEVASLEMLVGDLDGAERALERTRALLAELGAGDTGGMMQLRLAEMRARRGDLHSAREMLEASLRDDDRLDEETALIKVTLAPIALGLGDRVRASELVQEALTQLDLLEYRHAEQGHAHAIALSVAALIDLDAGEIDAARGRIGDAARAALDTRDMPLVASVGVTIAALREREGRPADAAEMLGVAARLRGAEEPTHLEVARLTTALRAALGDAPFTAAHARGRALDRPAAVARLEVEAQTRRR